MEAALRIKAQDFLGGSYLVIAQRSTVDTAGIHLIRGRVADNRLYADEGRTIGFCLSSLDSSLNGYDIFSGFHRLDVPAVGLISGHHIFIEGNICIVFNRDSVIVPEDDQVAQLLRAGQGRSLRGNAFL